MQFVISTRQKIGWDESRHWHKALSTSSNSTDLYLPVASEGTLLGILFMCLSPQSTLANADRQVVTSLMNHIAVVLHRAKLLEAQANSRALAETNRLKTALLQMVSHDFRSPLASIKASVSSLLADEGKPIDASTQRGLLQAIEQETDRLNRMVGNLLDLSKLEANVWQPQREPCSLPELVGSALDSFSIKDNDRIHVSLPATVPEISVDPVQLIQVLRNLLENALKYSQGTVELSACQQGAYLTLEIADRGSGLPPGDEARIFEPFYRAKQHQESSLPGIGMGLAVCRGLIEAHGGTLRAMNRPGGGSVFCINLPIDQSK